MIGQRRNITLIITFSKNVNLAQKINGDNFIPYSHLGILY